MMRETKSSPMSKQVLVESQLIRSLHGEILVSQCLGYVSLSFT